MTAINNCGNNHACSADLLDQMGAALKKNNFDDKQIKKALIPYLVGIGNQSKDRLFEVFMKLKSDYVGTMTHPDFPEELRKHIRGKSMAAVKDYEEGARVRWKSKRCLTKRRVVIRTNEALVFTFLVFASRS